MVFRPKVRESIVIETKNYNFTEHPAALNMVYGQTGRRATVYQLQDEAGGLHALKVFTTAWRDPRNAVSAHQLHTFANNPGLEVCDRQVFTPESYADLIRAYPDLEYAVLMSWVSGETWQEVMLNARPLKVEQSRELGLAFLNILAGMEQQGIAHCDLSGPNVLLNFSPVQAALVDVEDLYGPGLVRPEKVGGGSSGYAHKTAPKGLWRADADRFAGAILLAEMLGWSDERVRRIGYGEQYFDPAEVQQGSERYQVLLSVLREQWGNQVAEAFARVWFSEQVEDCPSFQEWQNLLNASGQEQQMRIKVENAKSLLENKQVEKAIIELKEALQITPETANPVYARALLLRGNQFFIKGDLNKAQADYQKALTLSPDVVTTEELTDAIEKAKKCLIERKIQEAGDLVKQGEVKTGLADLKKLYHDSPELASKMYARALLESGLGKERAGDLKGAQKEYQAGLLIVTEKETWDDLQKGLIQINEQIGREKVEIGEELLGKDKLEKSIVVLSEAYKLAPEIAAGPYARALLTRGTTNEQGNDLEGALLDYQKALELAPEGGLKNELSLIVSEMTAKVALDSVASANKRDTPEMIMDKGPEVFAEDAILMELPIIDIPIVTNNAAENCPMPITPPLPKTLTQPSPPVERKKKSSGKNIGLIIIGVLVGLFLLFKIANTLYMGYGAEPNLAEPVSTSNSFDNLVPTSDLLLVYTSEGGTITQDPNDNFQALYGAGVDLQNCVIAIEVLNPYSIDESPWSYSIAFRHSYASDNAYFLNIYSYGSWELQADIDGVWSQVSTGYLPNLDISTNGSNRIAIEVFENNATFTLNDQYISTLDVSRNMSSGDVRLVVGQEISGKQTDYKNFSIWVVQ